MAWCLRVGSASTHRRALDPTPLALSVALALALALAASLGAVLPASASAPSTPESARGFTTSTSPLQSGLNAACDNDDNVENKPGHGVAEALTHTAVSRLYQDNGGWDLPPNGHRALDSGTVCNIPRVTHAQWLLMYTGHNEDPVVIVDYPRSSEFITRCRKDQLLQHYRETEIVLSSANTFSYDKNHQTLKKYLEEMLAPVDLTNVAGKTWYHFGDNKYDDWANFTEHYRRPAWEYARDPFFSFGIGASGSGVPFHTHGAVFAEVLYGRKRWFLSRPELKPTYDPDETSIRWLTLSKGAKNAGQPRVASGEASEDLYDCTLGPGEVLYIGHTWWHSTLNIGQTVFISTFV